MTVGAGDTTVSEAAAQSTSPAADEAVVPKVDEPPADEAAADEAAVPWPTGRHKRTAPSQEAPALPARPLVLRSAAAHRPPPPPLDPSAPRPRIVDDTGILGLSRLSNSRLGSRLFTLFFVFVFALIFVQLIASLLNP